MKSCLCIYIISLSVVILVKFIGNFICFVSRFVEWDRMLLSLFGEFRVIY